MMKKIGFIIYFSCVLISCKAQSLDKELKTLLSYTVDTISVETLNELIQNNDSIVLIDSRSKEEYEVSHIEGAKFVDYDSFSSDDIKLLKNKKIIIYCSVGYRSEKIGEKLIANGYSQVYNLYGGIFKWKNEGYSVVNLSNNETQKVHTFNKQWSKYLEKGEKIYD